MHRPVARPRDVMLRVKVRTPASALAVRLRLREPGKTSPFRTYQCLLGTAGDACHGLDLAKPRESAAQLVLACQYFKQRNELAARG